MLHVLKILNIYCARRERKSGRSWKVDELMVKHNIKSDCTKQVCAVVLHFTLSRKYMQKKSFFTYMFLATKIHTNQRIPGMSKFIQQPIIIS